MKETIGQTPRSLTKLIRDDHDESGKYYIHQHIADDDIVNRNERIRKEDLMPEGRKIPVIDGEVRYQFSFPSEQWTNFKKRYPDVWQQFNSKDQDEVLRASARIAILYPQYCTIAGFW